MFPSLSDIELPESKFLFCTNCMAFLVLHSQIKAGLPTSFRTRISCNLFTFLTRTSIGASRRYGRPYTRDSSQMGIRYLIGTIEHSTRSAATESWAPISVPSDSHGLPRSQPITHEPCESPPQHHPDCRMPKDPQYLITGRGWRADCFGRRILLGRGLMLGYRDWGCEFYARSSKFETPGQ
jgi:hypothetical protein